MANLVVFTQLSMDGYFTDEHGDMSFAHQAKQDAEWSEFVAGNASGGGVLLFGRVTYEMMASYWPTPQAQKNDPVVAKQMNELPKVVFSRTLQTPAWSNTRLVKNDIANEVRKLKKESQKDLVILGSGSIVSQLTQAGLVDEFQFIVNPIVLGKGKELFVGLESRLPLKLIKSRTFNNGNVLLCYEPSK